MSAARGISMVKMLSDAWSGWLNYTDSGKLVVIFAVLTAYMVFVIKTKGIQRRFVLYGAIAGVLCILPPTAALLMFYQTRFYDYQWIWSIFPGTALAALGGTVFLTEQWKADKKYKPFWIKFIRNSALTLMCVGIVVLCGGLGKESVNAGERREEYERAESVLGDVREICGEDFCLWAPKEILEYARTDGNIRLLYGRNMWDKALDAYSYDTYTEDMEELYLWMESFDEYDIGTGEADAADAIRMTDVSEYIGKAMDMGADCILIPEGEPGWTPAEESAENLKVIRTDGYYLITAQSDAG